jgi:exodeoxyribonuclease-1
MRPDRTCHGSIPGPQDEHRIAEFHEASWPDALSIALTLDDDRLRALGLRLIYFAARSVLPEKMRLEIERALTDRLVNDEVGIFTLGMALRETQALLSSGSREADVIVSDYRSYLASRIDRVTAFRAQQLTSTT